MSETPSLWQLLRPVVMLAGRIALMLTALPHVFRDDMRPLVTLIWCWLVWDWMDHSGRKERPHA